MRDNVEAIARALGPRCELIELGSGVSLKTCILIEHLVPPIYVPIDISESALHGATATFVGRFPWLNIAAVRGDFVLEQSATRFSMLRPRDASKCISGA